MTFRQFLLTVRARWRIALMVFASVLVLAFIVTLTLPKQYTATASVVVDTNPDPVAGNYQSQMLPTYMATQVDIVSSDRVARRVVELLKLSDRDDLREQWQASTQGRIDFTAWLAKALGEKLTVSPSQDSNVINISVRWTDATMAAELANGFARAYIHTSIDLKVQPAKQYATWYDERSRDLRADLVVKQKHLTEFQRQTGIVINDQRLDIESARLADLTTQLLAVQSQRLESQSRQQGGGNEFRPEVLQNSVIAGLKADLSRAEVKRGDIGTRQGDNHPDYVAASAEVDSLRRRIAQETGRVVASFGSSTELGLRREAGLEEAIEAQKKRLFEFTEQRDAAVMLKNDVDAAQRNFDAVTARLAQTSLESQSQQANIVLLAESVAPLAKSSPKTLLNLLLGSILGGILSIAIIVLLEFLDQRVRTEEELLQLVGAPLLGTIAFVAHRSSTRGLLAGQTRKPTVA